MASSQPELALHHGIDRIELSLDHLFPARVRSDDDELRRLGVMHPPDELGLSTMSFMHVDDDAGIVLDAGSWVAADDDCDRTKLPELCSFSVRAVAVERDLERCRPFLGGKSMQTTNSLPGLGVGWDSSMQGLAQR